MVDPTDEKEPADSNKPKAKNPEQSRSQKAFTSPTSPTSLSPGNIDVELRGRTLRTYLYILKSSKPVGVRELQRALELSSPSVAFHHLEKLERLGLVQKNEYGEYALIKNVDVNVLQAFSQIGKLLVPRFIFYAMFFTTLLVGYLLIFGGNSNLFALAFGIFAAAFAWYETARTWRKRPF